MRKFSILIFILLHFASCKWKTNKEKLENSEKIDYEQVSTADYQLEKPKSEPNAVLVLFGGYPEEAEDIKREFQILETAREHAIAVVYSSYNKKLWFEENELEDLAKHLQKIFVENKLTKDNIYIGGFSSGGDVALLIGNYLTANQKIGLLPKGIFIIDSPIDLAELYFSSEKNIKREFSEISIQESTWLIEVLEDRFGNPHVDLKEYEKHSVFTLKTRKISNIESLKKTKIRMYTEPDTLWWKENRMVDYDQTNAYLIKKLSEILQDSGYANVEYIATQNRGYRANKERHPHSWSIVNVDELINWMLSK